MCAAWPSKTAKRKQTTYLTILLSFLNLQNHVQFQLKTLCSKTPFLFCLSQEYTHLFVKE